MVRFREAPTITRRPSRKWVPSLAELQLIGMTDKESTIREGLAAIDSVFQRLLHMRAETKEAADFLRTIMDPKQLSIYDLALQCETEMLKCNAAEAYFAGCLMGAAMNEALLSLICLFYPAEVENTKQYGWSTKKGKRGSFQEVVGSWKLEQFIKVAEELDWIPRDVVAPQFVTPLSDAYRELATISDPKLSTADVARGAALFEVSPGPAMLRMIQDLRNSIHSGRWIKSEQLLHAFHFDGWCRIAIHVSGEIRNCLIHRITQKNIALLTSAMERFESIVGSLPARMIAEGMGAAEFDRIVEAICAEVLEQRSPRK